MGQKSLIYASVARGTVIVAEFTEFKGNFTTIAAQCLEKLPSSNNKFTYNCDGHTFNYLVENGFKFVENRFRPKRWVQSHFICYLTQEGETCFTAESVLPHQSTETESG